MTTSLDDLIAEHWDVLVDEITKDAIRQIPSYGEAPLRLTMERVERWLKTLVESISQNAPPILAQYLASVAEERREEGYAVRDLHAIVHITERRISDLVARTYSDPVERNAQIVLLDAVMDSARMVLSVTYVLSRAARES